MSSKLAITIIIVVCALGFVGAFVDMIICAYKDKKYKQYSYGIFLKVSVKIEDLSRKSYTASQVVSHYELTGKNQAKIANKLLEEAKRGYNLSLKKGKQNMGDNVFNVLLDTLYDVQRKIEDIDMSIDYESEQLNAEEIKILIEYLDKLERTVRHCLASVKIGKEVT